MFHFLFRNFYQNYVKLSNRNRLEEFTISIESIVMNTMDFILDGREYNFIEIRMSHRIHISIASYKTNLNGTGLGSISIQMVEQYCDIFNHLKKLSEWQRRCW